MTIDGSYFSTKKVDGEFMRPLTVGGQISGPFGGLRLLGKYISMSQYIYIYIYIYI